MSDLKLLRSLPEPSAEIVDRAWREVDTEYSFDGDPYNYAPANMYFMQHNGKHSRAVTHRFDVIANAIGLTAFEREIGLMTAATHDVVCLLDAESGENEAESAKWLTDKMHQYGDYYPETAYMLAQYAIEGTGYRVNNNRLIQTYTEREAHSVLGERSIIVARALGQADIGHFFTPTGPEESHRLYRERYVTNYPPDFRRSLIEFQKTSIDITDNINIGTNGDVHPVTCTVSKMAVLEHQQHILDLLETDGLNSFEELMKLDEIFRRKYE